MLFNVEDDLKFIKEDLLPELVYERCFCDVGSREFVEFRSASVDPNPKEIQVPLDGTIMYTYSAKIEVEFSGVPRTFPVIVKLVPKSVEESHQFGYFMTEEYFYTKMRKKFTIDIFPKCYFANLGKYGRPVVVVEDLLEKGYQNSEGELSEEEMNVCLGKIGQFHGEGLRLKEEEPEIFREFWNNIHTVEMSEEKKGECNRQLFRDLRGLKLDAQELAELKNDPIGSLQNYNSKKEAKFHTLCHGNLTPRCIYFKYENGRLCEVKFDCFVFMKISSIGLHFKTFLLLNDKKVGITSLSLMRDYIQAYCNGIRRTYAKVSEEELRKQIGEASTFTYVNVLFLKL